MSTGQGVDWEGLSYCRFVTSPWVAWTGRACRLGREEALRVGTRRAGMSSDSGWRDLSCGPGGRGLECRLGRYGLKCRLARNGLVGNVSAA